MKFLPFIFNKGLLTNTVRNRSFVDKYFHYVAIKIETDIKAEECSREKNMV